MRAAIVMPCLNEQTTLEAACKSLGFGRDARRVPSDDAGLILVDNGSEDATRAVMERVRQNSPSGSVVVVEELERGYVPPRHRGALEARSIARSSGVPESAFLILQADADTTYCDGYVSEMMRTAEAARGDCIVEAVSTAPPDFALTYPRFGERCAIADASVQHLCVGEDDDIVVDDKTCAYTLANYFRWGGHRREYASNGDEIHAETSRLYIKAHFGGARRVQTNDAVAWPSRRKIAENPVLHFATAGFPRERAWRQRWDADSIRMELDDFVSDDADRVAGEVALVRNAHALILFGLLPAYVAKLAGVASCQRQIAVFSDLFPSFGGLTKSDVISNTAVLFERGFAMIDTQWPLLMQHLAARS